MFRGLHLCTQNYSSKVTRDYLWSITHKLFPGLTWTKAGKPNGKLPCYQHDKVFYESPVNLITLALMRK